MDPGMGTADKKQLLKENYYAERARGKQSNGTVFRYCSEALHDTFKKLC